MAEFLHGVETVQTSAGPRPTREVRTAIIGIVGLAPVHHAAEPSAANTILRLLSDRDVPRVIGPELAGYNIPSALDSIYDQGGATVVVINVFDPAVHRAVVAVAPLAVVAGKIAVPHADLISVVVTTVEAAPVPCVEGVDYTVDLVAGVITVLDGGLLDGDATANVAYVRADPSLVVEADVAGGVDGGGNRTGISRLLDVQSVYGFAPKILITPGLLGDLGIAALRTVAASLKAIAYVDAPIGATRDEIIGSRAVGAAVDLSAADGRLVYCYPALEFAGELRAYSAYLAGVTARTDAEIGYWRSPSNRPIVGPTGLELPLTAAVNDPSCDVNQLNAAGIVTVFSGYGLGLRTWGNRSSLFPGEIGILTFIACQRVLDVVDESVELAALAHLDGSINDVFIENVLADANAFVRLLIGRGALMPGSRVEYDPADNPVEQLADGHINFRRTWCPPPPAERITYTSVLDINLLQIGG